MDQADIAGAWELLWRDAILDGARCRAAEAGAALPPGAGRDCRGCGDPIPPERLAVMPLTERCTGCASELERPR